jgi:hypothetical protein
MLGGYKFEFAAQVSTVVLKPCSSKDPKYRDGLLVL